MEKTMNSNHMKDEAEYVEILEEKRKDGCKTDCLVEINRNEIVLKSEITDFDIRSMVVRCSSCGQQINHNDPSKIRRHRRLGVLTCKDCHEFYGSSEFSQDETGYNYCTWCGNGGKLFVCDYCPNGFCSSCIRRNFGRAEVSETSKEGWKCYCCNRKRLKPKIAFCDLIMQYSKRVKEHKEKKRLNSVPIDKKLVLSQDWVKHAFKDTEDICRIFQRRIQKLKDIGVSKSKSLKHIIKKLEQIINIHKSDLKNVVNTLSKQYALYLENQMKEEEISNNEQNTDHVMTSNAVTEKAIKSAVNGEVMKKEVNIENGECEIIKKNNDSTDILGDHMSDDNLEAENVKNIIIKGVNKEEKMSENIEKPTINGISFLNAEDSDKRNKTVETDDKKSVTIEDGKSSEAENDVIAKDAPLKNSEETLNNQLLSEVDPVISILESHDNISDSFSDSISEHNNTKSNDNLTENILAKMSLLEPSSNSESEDAGLQSKNSCNLINETSFTKGLDSTGNVSTKESTNFSHSPVLSDSSSSFLSDVTENKRSKKKKKEKNIQNKKACKTEIEKIPKLKLKFSNETCSDASSDKEISKATKTKHGKSPFKKHSKSLLDPLTSDSENSVSVNSDSDKNEKHIKSLDDHVEEHIHDVDENDPQLKLEVRVNLQCCDKMLKNGETSVKLLDIDDYSEPSIHHSKQSFEDIDKLEKLVDNLSKFNVNAPEKKKASQGKKKPKSKVIKVKEVEDASSSSICFSSEEEVKTKIKEAAKSIDLNTLAKKQLMNFDSSSEISSDSDVVETKKSKSGGASAKRHESSSDDFQPKKKKKFDKLLHGKLLSDEEETSNKTSRGKKSKGKVQCKRKLILSDNEEQKKLSKSGSSDESTTNSEEERRKGNKQKKRKRIKELSNSSSDDCKIISGSQDTPGGKGRKNINKIISQKDLTEETKVAQQLEKERKKRILERQKLYNKITDTSADGKEVITRKLVLEVDPVSKEEVVEIHPDIIEKLKPHQVNGVKFMWECTIESIKDLHKPGSGCILAHCMGLGKTLQVIAFLLTCFTNDYVSKKIKTAMIVCPYNTLLNWANEFDIWLSDICHDIKIHQLGTAKSNDIRLEILEYWHSEGGVVIISYDIFRRLAATKIPRFRTKLTQKMHEYLLDPGPDIVICDEGHVLKNVTSAISKAMNKLRTKRRIVLTGTPLQNNLQEYHCMLSFVKPHLLGTAKEFRNRFVNPIMNGQYDDSNLHDVKLMKKRTHILHKLLDGCVQRCDYSALTKFLPPKQEYVISVKLSEIQTKMYRCYLERLSQHRNDSKTSGTTLFTDFNSLRCIWTHPYMCHLNFLRAEKKMLLEDEDDDSFINDSEITSAESSGEGSDKSKSSSDAEEVIKSYKTRRRQGLEEETVEEPEAPGEKQWYHEFISDDDKYRIELSGKLILLIDILKECEAIGDKIIVFSQSLLTLDLIEDVLTFIDQQPPTKEDEIRDTIGTWVKGMDYFRMDGSTSADYRKSYIDMFNNPDYDRARLFLISTRAGSLGTNLVGANRVVIFDTSWNPCHDVQAIFRVFRFGQKKPVYIYRLLAQGTMEEKIYDRQVTKLSLSIRVVDEQQIDRHFSAADLAELYTFNPESTTNRPTPMVPKDRLLAEMLIKNCEWIVTYHEHDSLLQNETEEDLTEEERQAAWTEYENEREGRIINPGINEEDISKFYIEPDFNLTDYEDRKIPDIKVIIQAIANRLVQKTSTADAMEFRKDLLQALFAVRSTFQEKHVKILRMKQEYVARGTVPNAINKYLDELNQILKSLSDYISSVQMSLTDMMKKETINRIQRAQAQSQAQVQRGTSADQFRMRFPNNQIRMGTGVHMAAQMPHVYQILTQGQRIRNVNFQPRAFPNQNIPRRFVHVNIPTHTYMRSQNRQPVVSEPPEEAILPDRVETSNSTSTVRIEEVE